MPKQIAENHQPFSGANAAFAMPAVPVLKKNVSEEEIPVQQKKVDTRQEHEAKVVTPGLQLRSVIQAVKKTVSGIEVDTGGGYTTWNGWHINWQLGSKKGQHEQYHLTSQDRAQHYFFIINNDILEDTKPPSNLVPKQKKGHIVGGLSNAPKDVQDFVRKYFRQLM